MSILKFIPFHYFLFYTIMKLMKFFFKLISPIKTKEKRVFSFFDWKNIYIENFLSFTFFKKIVLYKKKKEKKRITLN